MTLDMIKQNAQSMIELVNNKELVIKEKNFVLNDIEKYKKINDKVNIDSSIKKLEAINLELDKIRTYMIKIIVNNQKIIEEEKNNLK